MASHLTITSGTGASASSRAFAGQQPGAQSAVSEPTGLLGLFAALVGNVAQGDAAAPVNGAAQTAPRADADLDLTSLFGLGLENGFGGTAEDGDADAEALAAASDGPAQSAHPAEPKPMVAFIEALRAMRISLDRGEPLDPDLVSKVETALAELAEALGLDIETLPVPEDFAALLATTGDDETGFAGSLALMLAPLAQSLATAQPATDAESIASISAASAQVKALGDKLAALLAALEDGAVAADKLAALGMKAGEPLDAEIEAALNRYASGLAGEKPVVPKEPSLAAPALKLTEPVLAGKGADGIDRTEPASTPARSTGAPPASAEEKGGTDQSDQDRGRDRPDMAPREARTRAPAAPPAAVDASGNPAPSADASAQQPAGARVDAAANPRIIQAGYQTSQQQLNLPQIAFELARQVQDGNTRFQIRLDPPELGRIDVRLDIDQSGQVHARLTVEKSETLDLMQRDQRGLERALQQAGLDSSKTNLEFSLKQNPFAGQQGQMGDGKDQADAGGPANDNGPAGAAADDVPPTVNLYRGALQASGVNIIA